MSAVLTVEVAILAVTPVLPSPILSVPILVDAVLLATILLTTILALAVVGPHLAVSLWIVAIRSAVYPVPILTLLVGIAIAIGGALPIGLAIGVRLPLTGLTLLAVAAVGLPLLLTIGLTLCGIGLRWSKSGRRHEWRRRLGRGETIGNTAVIVILPLRVDGVGLTTIACLSLLSTRDQPEVMFRMLQVALSRNRIARRLRIPRKLQILFGDMMSITADLDVRTV